MFKYFLTTVLLFTCFLADRRNSKKNLFNIKKIQKIQTFDNFSFQFKLLMPLDKNTQGYRHTTETKIF